MKISIIIPIYNAERFLRDTLQDTVCQTLTDIEIICVDDGSTDASVEIVRSFMEQDPRIRLICQKNQYCGAARNAGMAQAGGEYLCFWDADDRFAPDTLELMYNQAKATNADVCVCGVSDLDSETNTIFPREAYLNVKSAGSKQPFNKYDIPDFIFNFTSNHVWNKLFRHEFIREHQLAFDPVGFSEETMFTQPALYYAERICYVNKPLIRYRIFNTDSAIMNLSSREVKYNKTLYNFYAFMKETGEFDTFRISILNKCLGSFIVDLEAIRSFEAFCSVYEEMKTKVFRDFGLSDVDEDLIRMKINYRKMRSILEMEPGDYLLQYGMIQKRDLLLKIEKQRAAKTKAQSDTKKKAEKIKQQEIKLADAEKKLKKLDELQAELNKAKKELTKIEKLEKALTEQKAKNDALAAALQESEKRVKALEESTSFKIGKAITFLPGKIKRMTNKKERK